jgi:hypothetical protein
MLAERKTFGSICVSGHSKLTKIFLQTALEKNSSNPLHDN